MAETSSLTPKRDATLMTSHRSRLCQFVVDVDDPYAHLSHRRSGRSFCFHAKSALDLRERLAGHLPAAGNISQYVRRISAVLISSARVCSIVDLRQHYPGRVAGHAIECPSVFEQYLQPVPAAKCSCATAGAQWAGVGTCVDTFPPTLTYGPMAAGSGRALAGRARPATAPGRRD